MREILVKIYLIKIVMKLTLVEYVMDLGKYTSVDVLIFLLANVTVMAMF
jgi:hypothetical protein